MRGCGAGTAGVAIAAVVVLGACNLSAPPFVCILSEDCNPGGSCEPTGVCSEPDRICESLRRYSPSAGDVAGQCVPGGPDDSGSVTTGPDPMVGGPCERADECDDADGFCEATDWCSYRDDTCETGRRYGRSDDAALQGECVEAIACKEVIDDKFKDAEIDTSIWRVVAQDEVEASWLVEANSRMNYRMAAGASGYLGLHSVANYDFSGGRIEIDITRAPSMETWIDAGLVSTHATAPDYIFAIFSPTTIDLWAGEESKSAPIDYAETPVVALDFDGANMSVEVSTDGETFEEILSDRHDYDVSNMIPYFEVWTNTLGADETVSLGSVDICALE